MVGLKAPAGPNGGRAPLRGPQYRCPAENMNGQIDGAYGPSACGEVTNIFENTVRSEPSVLNLEIKGSQ